MSALFSWTNALDGALLVAGAKVGTLPVQNLADFRLQKPWRSGAASTYFTADFRAVTALGVIGLFGCTLSPADTIRIRLSNVAPGNSELLDTTALAGGVADGYFQYVYVPSASIAARYMRIDINAASRAGIGYFDMGRAWAGPAWKPTINFSLGWGEGWQDDSNIVRAPRSGAVFVDAVAPYRTMNLTFDYLTDAEKAQVLAMDRVAGKRNQVLFVPDTAGDLTTGPLLGRLTDTGLIKQALDIVPPVYSKTYNLQQDQ